MTRLHDIVEQDDAVDYFTMRYPSLVPFVRNPDGTIHYGKTAPFSHLSRHDIAVYDEGIRMWVARGRPKHR